jgi:hypothetical protein
MGSPAQEVCLVADERVAVLAHLICTLGLMARGTRRPHTRAMRSPVLHSSSLRDAGSELYDRGRDLVHAATAIRRVADNPGAARAAPALLGFVEAALRELGTACATLEQTTAGPVEAGKPVGSDPRLRRRIDRMRGGFTNLYSALDDAEAASAAARALVARTLAAAPGHRRDATSR